MWKVTIVPVIQTLTDKEIDSGKQTELKSVVHSDSLPRMPRFLWHLMTFGSSADSEPFASTSHLPRLGALISSR